MKKSTNCRRMSTGAWARSRRRSPSCDNRPRSFDPGDIARAGAFVSIDAEGLLSVDRGYVRPEDEPPAA